MSFQFGQTIGTSWSNGNALLAYDLYRRDHLDANDRDFTEAAVDPTDLLPDQERHSLFLSARKALSESVEVFGDAFYSKRDADSLGASSSTGSPTEQQTETEQVGASVGVTKSFGNKWQTRLVGAYSTTDVLTGLADFEVNTFTESLAGDLSTWTLDVKADGPISSIPGGDISVAIGGQCRREEILFTNPFSMSFTDDNRDVYALFSEVNVPFVSENNSIAGVHRLEVTAAVRHENYSDFGSTTDPKIGAAWSPVDGLNFRGTFGTSFRAPLLRELDSGFAIGFLAFLPDPESMTGTTLAVVGRGGNPDLEPETATTWTAGFDFSPPSVPGLKVSGTYFDIEFDGRIQPTFAAFSALTDPLFAPLVDRNPDPNLLEFFGNAPTAINFAPGFEFTDAEIFVDERNRNISSVITRGVDLQVRYQTQTNLGVFGASISGTHLFEQTERQLPDSVAVDVVDTVFHPTDLRLRGTFSWSHKGWVANVTFHHVDGYQNDLVDPVADVNSWTTTDVYLGYEMVPSNDSVFSGAVLSLIVQNAFDEEPPFIAPNFNSIHFDATNANALGRTIALQLQKRW